jgi:hypothetical protein
MADRPSEPFSGLVHLFCVRERDGAATLSTFWGRLLQVAAAIASNACSLAASTWHDNSPQEHTDSMRFHRFRSRLATAAHFVAYLVALWQRRPPPRRSGL